MVESRYSARIRWLPMDVGIATELNSAVCVSALPWVEVGLALIA